MAWPGILLSELGLGYLNKKEIKNLYCPHRKIIPEIITGPRPTHMQHVPVHQARPRLGPGIPFSHLGRHRSPVASSYFDLIQHPHVDPGQTKNK
jgi:hypothetical protein